MKKKMKNLVGVLLLSLALAVTLIPVSDVEATTTATSDFQLNGTKLVKYQGTASTVSIPNTVKEIGEEAFADNTTLVSVNIPATVEKIAYGAFADCTSLEHISIPNGTKELGNGVFAGCGRLTKVSFGKDVKEVGSGVFAGCVNLQSVDVSKNNKYIVCDSGVLYDKGKTKVIQMMPGRKNTTYHFPATVTEIMPYAFWGVQNLQKTVLSQKLHEIPAYAFSNCMALTGIEIPYSVYQIHTKAFENCISLEEAIIHPSVSYIHDTAFDGCGKLTITAEEGTKGDEFANSHTFSELENAENEDLSGGTQTDSQSQSGMQNQGSNAPNNNTPNGNVQNQTAGYEDPLEAAEDSSVLGKTRVIGRSAVVIMDGTKQTVHSGPETETEQGTVENEINHAADTNIVNTITQMNSLLSDEADEKGYSIPKYAVAGDKIAAQAYYGEEALEKYTIENDITQIGDFAFARSNLKEIAIPDSVVRIGYGAFYHCDNLETISIPSSVTEIEPYAFEKTKWLSNWEKNGTSDFLMAGDGFLIAYKGNGKNISLPEQTKYICAGVFRNHNEIETVEIPDSLLEIGEGAFENCTNLKTMSGGMYVERIKDRAFAGCPLETVRVVGSVKEIGLRAFDFSQTDKIDTTKTVVFMGDTLPALSYEKTASRLSNADYRDLALKDVSVAIVNDSVTDFSGTVLDASVSGFRGIVCSVEMENDAFGDGTLTVKYCSIEPDESGNIEIPRKVSFFGKEYTISDTEGVSSETAGKKKVSAPAGFVSVESWNKEFSDTDVMTAVINGDNGIYKVVINTAEEAEKAELAAAYENIYGVLADTSMCVFDLSCQEEESKIPITKLGNKKMYLTLPIPAGISEQNLHAVCTDEDGQLEEVPYELTNVSGAAAIKLEISRFSAYALYNYESKAVVSGEEKNQDGTSVFTAQSGKKDASPDTGDGIHPKWFLVSGLVFFSAAIFLSNRKWIVRKTS